MSEVFVLLVDDEAEFLETLIKRLRKRSVQAFGAGSGEEALAFLDGQPVDVIVLDVKMPGMDGIQTLRAIKKQDPLVEVIMLTGHASMEAAVEGMELGAFDYLMKPINIDDLLYKIEDAHKKRALHEEKIRRMEDSVSRG